MSGSTVRVDGLPMRALIADDHGLLRDTLEHFLRQEAGIDPVGVGDLPSALEAIERDGPFDLVVLDVAMPGMNGLEGLRRALEMPGARAVAAMSGNVSRDLAERVLELGAAGFLPKTLPARTLANALRFMALGERYAPLDLMTAGEGPPQHPMAARLSPRELQVLEGLCRGKANKEIARDLDVMEPTVKLHVKTLYRKLGVTNRTQAAVVAKESGLF